MMLVWICDQCDRHEPCDVDEDCWEGKDEVCRDCCDGTATVVRLDEEDHA